MVPSNSSVEPDAPLMIPLLVMSLERVVVVLDVMFIVAPAGICTAPSTDQFPPVVKDVDPEELDKMKILSELKFKGLPPEPSLVPDQLEVLLSELVAVDFT